jgi:uncharacterized membrane-anchored protein
MQPTSETLTRQVTTREIINKVPAITATFWLIKILSTTIGETFADFLAVNVGLGTAVTDGVMFAVLAVTLFAQLRTRRYTPWLYWLTVVLVSIVGTQITDFFTDQLGVSLYVSTAVFAVVLAVVFTIWWRQERTLAITAIDTPRRERFYWAAVLTTFALGTAGGDLATEALSLGFRVGVLIFGGLILATWAAKKLGMNAVLAFWIAYVLTRPLGASLGDLLTQSRAYGGVGLGASVTSLLFLTVIIVLVAREQVLVNRHGVRSKGDTPAVNPRHDYAWAAGGAATVIGAALLLTSPPATPSATAAPQTVQTPGSASTGSAAPAPDTTSPLGDLTSFSAISHDVSAKVAAGDQAGARTRIKDLEVAWDDAEAAIKPASPGDWHTMDSAIDDALTAVRTTPPSQADSAAAMKRLQQVIVTLDQKK